MRAGQNRAVTDVKVLRDMLAALSQLIKTHRKYGTESVTLASMADELSLKDLANSLTPAKLRFLLAGITSLTEMQQDMQNIMGSEPAQLDGLGGNLDGVVADLDRALRGL